MRQVWLDRPDRCQSVFQFQFGYKQPAFGSQVEASFVVTDAASIPGAADDEMLTVSDCTLPRVRTGN